MNNVTKYNINNINNIYNIYNIDAMKEGLDLALAVAHDNDNNNKSEEQEDISNITSTPIRPSKRKGSDRNLWSDAECVCELLLCYSETYLSDEQRPQWGKIAFDKGV